MRSYCRQHRVFNDSSNPNWECYRCHNEKLLGCRTGCEVAAQMVEEEGLPDYLHVRAIAKTIDSLPAWREGDAHTLARWLVAKGIRVNLTEGV